MRAIIGDVQWTPVYVGFLLYIFVIVTYRLPIATAAMILALAALLVQRERIRFPPLVLWFGIFILWGIVGYTQTRYNAVVWGELILFGKLWLIALVAVNALRTRGQIRFFLIFFLFCFATHPARGTIFNYLGGYTEFGRAAWNHIFGNPNDMAALVFFPLAIAAGLLKDENKWVRRGALASVVVFPMVILLTQSRGAFLALALFVTLTWVTQRRKLRTFALLAILGGIIAVAAPSGMWERMSELSEEGTDADSSSQQRYAIWQIAAEIIGDHRITGVGLGAYPSAHREYARTMAAGVLAPGARDTHSTYLNVTAETGFTGLSIFLILIGTTVVMAERARRKVKRQHPAVSAQIWYLEAGLFAYLMAAIFGSFAHLSFFYLHLATIAVLAHTVMKGLPQSRPPMRRRSVSRSGSPLGPDALTRRGQRH